VSAVLEPPPSRTPMPPPKRRNAATGSYKMDPQLLGKAKQLVPWLKGDLLKTVAPELHAEQEADDGGDVTLALYFDHLLRAAIERDHQTVMDWIAKHRQRRP
jgi:hypothetical protein